jgi:putative nucleotidyltransferase with HDIG domain
MISLEVISNAHQRWEGLPRRSLLVLVLTACIGLVTLTAAQLSRYVVGSGVVYNLGDVADRDIRAPYRLTYVSDVETNRQRDLAEASVAPIFTPPDVQTSRRQMSLAYEVLDYIQQIRNDETHSLDERIRKLISLDELSIRESTARAIMALHDRQWGRVSAQTTAVLDAVLRRPIHPGNLEEVRASVPRLISFSLQPDEAEIVTQLVSALIVPNTNYDAAATEAARRAAREAVKPVERKYEANQIIIRSGQIIGPSEIEALERFNLRRPELTWMDALSALMLSGLSVSLFIAGIVHTRANLFKRPARQIVLSMVLLAIAVILAYLLLPGRSATLPYLFPWSAIAMTIASWSGLLPGLLSALIMGGLVGGQLETALFIFAGGLAACLALGRVERLSYFLRAGLLASLAQSAVLIAMRLPLLHASDLPMFAIVLAASLLSGVLSAGLTIALLYLSGFLFDVTTVVQLIELSRLSHPLLKRMVTQAPGTYHHTLMVAHLAENAAERIGADAMLTRVGAYFHDIGKLNNPQFFIENQLEGLNPHDQLDPLTSSTILRNHVTDGLKLAAKYRLPARLKDFIAEHHGTTKTQYQYLQACRSSNQPVDADAFRYPGPRPRSKETAIVMLADSSEAIVRAGRFATFEEMDAALRQLFADRLADHQLDDSDLTLRDIELVRQSFLETLRGVYHPRMQYPVEASVVAPTPAPQPALPQQELATP